MDFENMNIWCWLIPLLVGAICGLLGYFWGRGSAKTLDNAEELRALESKNAKLQADLEACLKKTTAAPKKAPAKAPSKAKATASLGAAAFDASAAKAAFGKRIKEDDLKIVEGIGPKIEGLFHNEGIKTWKALSEVSVAKCQKVLNTGGDRYRIHDPASWPMQAKMAYKGQWKKLVKWQAEHKAGKF
ncbi:MAG: hypothetical protein ED555_04760 [Allomuricauda sp.]|nr:MAG: hypothetical protein ED555_04760 [Allomuricauda sp.]